MQRKVPWRLQIGQTSTKQEPFFLASLQQPPTTWWVSSSTIRHSEENLTFNSEIETSNMCKTEVQDLRHYEGNVVIMRYVYCSIRNWNSAALKARKCTIYGPQLINRLTRKDRYSSTIAKLTQHNPFAREWFGIIHNLSVNILPGISLLDGFILEMFLAKSSVLPLKSHLMAIFAPHIARNEV